MKHAMGFIHLHHQLHLTLCCQTSFSVCAFISNKTSLGDEVLLETKALMVKCVLKTLCFFPPSV